MVGAFSRKSNRAIDLYGRRFGRWTVIGDSGKRTNAKILWTCVCDCGVKKEVVSTTLMNGGSESCGCLKVEILAALAVKGNGSVKKTHGMSKNRVYCVYRTMLARCNNKNNEKHHDYGGRGIKVCDRWSGRNGFENFIADMGVPEDKLLTIDRKDVNGDYCLDNCRWATNKQQARNKRSNKKVIWNGEERLLVELAEELGVSYKRAYRRLSLGWTVEESLSDERRTNPLKKITK